MVYQPTAPQPQYPGYYQQTFYQPQPITQQNPVWVKGEEEAKRYSIFPGSTVPLWDSENQIIYLKSADMNGMVSMKIIDYTIREDDKKDSSSADYVTKEDFKAFADKISEQFERLANQKGFVNRKLDKED